ncbi:alpha/beta hydrolase [Paraburkholderia dipogonis]|uniref:Alpha/beta hydrolase n=1 Tax=Paraburkholderia dipogonis TaxID=1211383 RepID=A0A4Y8MS62_9BURK|nr:alpha/beta hydrolase [Paraburkholderia dipogonis]TFE40356.1 alpha/beta hydrolase [Paraburkholderia dipogonis]
MTFNLSRRFAVLCASTGAAVSMTFAQSALAVHAYEPHLKPVATISDTRLTLDTPQGQAEFPLYLSKDWNVAQPQVTRAVIVIHGKLRNADVYFRTAQNARDAAHADPDATLLIAPQFLATLDTRVHDELADLLRWTGDAWMGGEAARAPLPISSYEVLDAIVARLADRKRFPNLRYVVFAGHSGGGQVVQRYAVAARNIAALTREGIDVRYVVASPSTYAYFDAQRPNAQGIAAPFDAAQCPDFNQWKYGMDNRPPYLDDRTPAQLEATYAARRIDYLVGGADDDPKQSALDRTCAAEAQGPQRVARAEAYYRYIQSRHPQGLEQSFHIVPGVGHNGARMLMSVCALSAMFDTPGCEQ